MFIKYLKSKYRCITKDIYLFTLSKIIPSSTISIDCYRLLVNIAFNCLSFFQTIPPKWKQTCKSSNIKNKPILFLIRDFLYLNALNDSLVSNQLISQHIHTDKVHNDTLQKSWLNYLCFTIFTKVSSHAECMPKILYLE